MSFYKEVPGLEKTLESTLKFDTTPTAGSTNPVTSDGVKTAIDGAVGDASEALQEQIDDIAEKAGSGYTPKGEATVATLNALSGQENGWLYTMTDAGTLTDGTLAVVAGDTVAWDATNGVWYKAMDYAPAQYGTNEVHNLPTTITAFRTGDVIPVDGPSGSAKMPKDDLLRVTAKTSKTKTPAIVEKTITDSEIVYGQFITPLGENAETTNRCRTRYIYARKGTLSVSCLGYDFRVTYFKTNSISGSTVIEYTREENQEWQDGDLGIRAKIPDDAINFIVSIRRKDNEVFTESDHPVVVASIFGGENFMPKLYNSDNQFQSSTNTFISLPQKIDKATSNHKEFLAVSVPPGYKARVLQCNSSTTFSGNIDPGDWHTSDFVQPFYLLSNFYAVQLRKTDDSDITDYGYLDCKIIETNNTLFGKVVSFLGDSITTFGGSTSDPDNARYAQEGDPTYPGNRCRYPQINLGFANDSYIYTYWMRLVRYFGFKFGISESWAGSMISNTQATDSGDFGPNRCISSQTRINHLAVNGTPDVIFVYGGTNDAAHNVTIGTFNTESPQDYSAEQIAALPVDTFANACRALFIRLQKTYPNAEVIVILPNYVNLAYTPQRLDPYCDMLKEACDYFGIKYVDIRTSGITMFNVSTYMNDGVHPNAKGMQKIANKILSLLWTN